MKKSCIQCGKEFEITEGERSFYEEKGLEIPKRCRECRKSNRIRKNDVVVKRPVRRGFFRGLRTGAGGMGGTGGAGGPRMSLILVIVVLAVIINGLFRGDDIKKSVPDFENQTTDSTQTPQSGTWGLEDTLIFRDWSRLEEHYKKHGEAMGYTSAEEYLAGANRVVKNSKSLHKKEKEDGDDVYFLEETGELVVVSTDGYIRTYFKPEDGIAYYNRQ